MMVDERENSYRNKRKQRMDWMRSYVHIDRSEREGWVYSIDHRWKRRINVEKMDFDNSISESDEDEEEFPPLPSDIETTTYINAREPYDNRHHAIDLFFCPSPPFPSPPPPPLSPRSSRSLLTSTGSMIRTYANLHTFASIRNHEARTEAHISFATQYKKKSRAPVVATLDSVYINIPGATRKTNHYNQWSHLRHIIEYHLVSAVIDLLGCEYELCRVSTDTASAAIENSVSTPMLRECENSSTTTITVWFANGSGSARALATCPPFREEPVAVRIEDG